MKKRGQSLSLFLILALAIILSASLMYYLFSGGNGESVLRYDQTLSQQADTVKNTVEDCLEQKTLEAKELFGLREDTRQLIEEHIENYLSGCVHDSLLGTGITFTDGEIDASTHIDSSLLIDIIYPITVISGENRQRISKFNYYLPLESSTDLQLDGSGRTTEEYRLLSHDTRVELIIPAGTKVTDSAGMPITTISLRTADRNEGGLVNSVVVGMTIYDGQPEGARFEPAIRIKMRYDHEELMGLPEKDLKIGWYDAARGFWWGLPSSEVDTADKIVSAEITHFTKIGTVGCTTPETGTLSFTFKNVVANALSDSEADKANPPVCQNNAKNAPPGQAEGTTPEGTLLCATQQAAEGEYTASFLCTGGNWIRTRCDSQGCDPSTQRCKADSDRDRPLAEMINSAGIPEPIEEYEGIKGCSCTCGSNCRLTDGESLAGLGITENLGYANFTIPPGGKACIMAKEDGSADISAEITGSDGDTFGNLKFSSAALFSGLGQLLFDTSESELKSGENLVFLDLENSNGDGCVWSEIKFRIKGKGIEYPKDCDSIPSGESAALEDPDLCTVQDAINSLCGENDPAYNDVYPGRPNCEADSQGNPIGFLDPERSPTLNSLIQEAESIAPEGWRSLPLSKLPSKDSVMAKLGQLGLNLYCNGGSLGYTCYSGSSSSSVTSGATDSSSDSGEEAGSGSSGSSLFSDPEASSSSKSCTAWEKSRTTAQIEEMIKAKASELGAKAGITDLDLLGDYLVAISDHEANLRHCDSSGKVVSGDEGQSIGLFALYQPVHGDTSCNQYRMGCNIQKGAALFISLYSACAKSGPRIYDCRESCSEIQSRGGTDIHGHSIASLDCTKEIETYETFECALRSYQGWGCTYTYGDGTKTYLGVGRDERYLSIVSDFRVMYPALSTGKSTSSTISTTGTLSGTSSALTCKAASTNSLGTCRDHKGELTFTVTECSERGGWPIYTVSDADVTSGRKVCCRQEGCCVSAGQLVSSTQSKCSGTFEKNDCSDVTGCCVWQDNGCKKAESTKKRCGSGTFFPLENSCEDHPECEEGHLGSNEICHYCGSNADAAREIDPDAECGDRCCEARCPSDSVIVSDTVYYNQCSFPDPNNKYCRSACGPTSLKMGLETTGHGTQSISALWDGTGANIEYGTGYTGLNSYACGENACVSPTHYTKPGREFFESQINSGNPLILLQTMVSYYPEGCASAGGHYFLVVGYSDDYMIVNDPYTGYCSHGMGSHLVITKSRFYSEVMSSRGGITIPIKGG